MQGEEPVALFVQPARHLGREIDRPRPWSSLTRPPPVRMLGAISTKTRCGGLILPDHARTPLANLRTAAAVVGREAAASLDA
jgi:hypothetical protein